MGRKSKPLNATLSGLSIGSLTLVPEFDPEVLEYAAETSNNTNTITATAADESATIEIAVNADPHTNGQPATWESGENTVVVKVTNGTELTVYTVVVTKS